MALNPGQTTTLSMTFTMPEGMGGPHDFRVHLPNNDPTWGSRTLAVLSNWVE
jgi:hypothetical protein